MSLITNSWLLDLLVFICIGYTTIYFYITHNHDYWKKRGVKSLPQPNILGNFGNALFLKKSFREILSDMYFYGEGEKLIGFYVFKKPVLLLRDPNIIKYVLVQNFKNFSNRFIHPNQTDQVGHFNIFAIKNPAWQVLRQSVSPIFSISKFKNMVNLIADVVRDLDTHLQTLITDGNIYSKSFTTFYNNG
jgi:cytochrome P450 family 6